MPFAQLLNLFLHLTSWNEGATPGALEAVLEPRDGGRVAGRLGDFVELPYQPWTFWISYTSPSGRPLHERDMNLFQPLSFWVFYSIELN